MASNGRILIVEDDPSVLAMLAEYLSSHDYEVVQADRGAAMREAVERSLPDVVLLDVGVCALDLVSHQLFAADGTEIPLTSMEFDLLRTFVERPNQVLSRDQLLTLTRNREWEPFDRSIDIRIARVRRKIEADPEHPQAIRTVRGAGYMFVPSRGAA
jgi:DNA-binding response OmpR family regulator